MDDSFPHSCHLRPDFVATDDEGHLAAPGVDEAGPAGVQGDVVTVLAAEAHGRVLERRLSCVLQDWKMRQWGKTHVICVLDFFFSSHRKNLQ